MMKNFSIEQINREDYGYLIIAISYDSPISDLGAVEKEIKGYTGKVIFDLTLINGTNSNRYLEAKVVKGKIDRRSFKVQKNLDDPINEVSKNFFLNNVDILEKSTITNALKFLLKTGQHI